MKTFMKIWGCVILIICIPCIYVTLILEMYSLVIFNIIMMMLGLWSCWICLQILEEKEKL